MGKLVNRSGCLFWKSRMAIFIFLIAFFCSIINVKAVAVGTQYMYDYTGEYQTFTAPESTWYKIELWGARGGQGRTNWTLKQKGGAGAYTSGEIYLEKGTKLYVYVGGNGMQGGVGSKCKGGVAGWNGGGTGGNDSNCDSQPEPGGGGGGATDIRLEPTSSPTIWDEFDSLKSRIMVAAGGGGGHYTYAGGAGGMIFGLTTTQNRDFPNQTSGFAFGLGQTGVSSSYGAGGGAGGYFGGYQHNNASGGGGGSSFVSGCNHCVAIDEDSTSTNVISSNSNVHYTGYQFDKIEMLSGYDKQPDGLGGYQTGNYGSGWAAITVAEHRSDNNYLRNITTSSGTLSPNFIKTTEEYDLVLDSNVSEVELGATVDDSKSVVGGLGKYQVKYGEPITANLSVTNELGKVRVYKINISRKQLASGEHSSKLADLSIKTINQGALLPKFENGFNSDTLEYNIIVSSTVAALDFDVVPFDSDATIVKEGTGKILGDSGTLKIIVSAPNCNDTTYLIHYTKEHATKLSNEYTAIGDYQEFIAPIYGKYGIELGVHKVQDLLKFLEEKVLIRKVTSF